MEQLSFISIRLHDSAIRLSSGRQHNVLIYGNKAVRVYSYHMQFPPFPCYLVPLRPKYLSRHPILEQPQTMFFHNVKYQFFILFPPPPPPILHAYKGNTFFIIIYSRYYFLIINPLKPELNPICYLLALLGTHHFLHVSRIRVKLLTFRRLMSYIWSTHS